MAPPPGMGPPPSIAGAPGMAAPGTAPPGVVAQAAPSTRPAGIPASFQGAANMPNINFSAPVIRLGTAGPKGAAPTTGAAGGREERSSRPGLGMDKAVDAAQQRKENLLNQPPPTKDEIVRTIFVAGITEGCGGDEGIERILRTAGRLRRWDRAIDADGKDCTFGFAQYEDPESLQTAVEVLKDIDVPVKKQTPGAAVKKESEEDKAEDDEKESEIEKKKLLVFVDDNSLKYLENWSNNRGDNPAGDQARLDSARASLKTVIHELFHPLARRRSEDADGDTQMHDANAESDNVEVVNIPMAQADDELSDIPAEMRDMVAKEIAAFRDRSIRRDMERLKREEEMEAAERARNGAPRPSRLASPGPSGGTNNVPLGPRDRSIANAPSGPKGGQMPRDYQKNVNFVNGSGTNGASSGQVWIDRADEDDSASDSELERRRVAKRKESEEKAYMDQERRWLNRERSRTAAVEREKERDEAEEAKAKIAKEKMAEKLNNWNDDEQASRRVDDYYADRSAWLRNRAAVRSREIAADDADRLEEEREMERAGIKKEARPVSRNGETGGFKMQMSSKTQQQQPFKLSLGAAAAQKAQTVKTARRTVAEVEGLLEDEEDESKQTRRQLIPIKYDPADRAASMTDEEREQAIKELAANIPADRDGLWKWDVQWEFVYENVIVEKLRPFVERKVVEYLGVQEQTIVDQVEEHIRKRGSASDLAKALEGALDEEAVVLVKKLWRMLIFFSESEKRGYSA